ncbi:FkbM family methyltransferase [Pelagibacterales bacterium SAG-MED43]|nr:FkbM family methyltransferase [Pelagibacterales bacterium SAG-MED43]
MFYSKIIISLLNFLDYFQKKPIIALFKKKFRKPIVVFDVGAHYGETIKLLLDKLNIKRIYSFEASPINFRVLERNTSKYPNDKVKIHNSGLGEKISSDFINQTVESSSSTMHNLNINSKYLEKKLKILNIKKNNKFFQKFKVEILTLDHFIKENNIDFIDLLKIDTEGYEFNVLKGLKEYSHKINLVYFEHHYDDMIMKNYTFGDIHHLLKKMNFRMIKKSKMIFRKSFEYVYENQNPTNFIN